MSEWKPTHRYKVRTNPREVMDVGRALEGDSKVRLYEFENGERSYLSIYYLEPLAPPKPQVVRMHVGLDSNGEVYTNCARKTSLCNIPTIGIVGYEPVGEPVKYVEASGLRAGDLFQLFTPTRQPLDAKG